MTIIKPQQASPFNNKRVFVGIDTHKRSWSVSIRIDAICIKTFSMNPSPDELVLFLFKNYLEASYHCVYEAGFGGFWIQESLQSKQIECIVVHVPDIPTSNKDKDRKNDNNDSKKLALELELGRIKGIYIPPKQSQTFKTLARSYHQAVTDVTRVKNRIKGIVNFYGINLPKHASQWSAKFIRELYSLNLNDSNIRLCLDIHLDDLVAQKEKQARILKHLKKILEEKEPKLLKRIQSVPGIGLKSAATLISEIGDMTRFKSADELKAFVGFIPSTHSSGETLKESSLTHRKNRFLRKIMVESAWVAIRHDKALTDCFFKLTSRMCKQKAITRIAKKLLLRLRAVWLGDFNYALGVLQ